MSWKPECAIRTVFFAQLNGKSTSTSQFWALKADYINKLYWKYRYFIGQPFFCFIFELL